MTSGLRCSNNSFSQLRRAWRLRTTVQIRIAHKSGLDSADRHRYKLPISGARSSAVEHYLDMVGVTGSIPVAPTTGRELARAAEAYAD